MEGATLKLGLQPAAQTEKGPPVITLKAELSNFFSLNLTVVNKVSCSLPYWVRDKGMRLRSTMENKAIHTVQAGIIRTRLNVEVGIPGLFKNVLDTCPPVQRVYWYEPKTTSY